MVDINSLKQFDPSLFIAMSDEIKRQEEHIELIASENYASIRVMQAQGSALTNKYAEGYPNARYYGGCEHVDVIESIAIDRANKLFGSAYANVQPHSGSTANAAAFMALINPGDKILGMSLSSGGHLTHGTKISFSGRFYDASVSYGVDENGFVDYDEIESIAKKHKPKMIIAGFSSYARIMDWSKFRTIADRVGASLVIDMAHVAGLVATGLYPNPVPFADIVTSTTHKTLRGPRSGLILSRDETLAKKINSAVFPGYQGGPLMHAIAAKAVCFLEAMQDDFKSYQSQVLSNANYLATCLMDKGVSLISNGTENHLMLVNLIGKDITGKDLNSSLGRANITANKNSIPNDPKPPTISSGIRIGTPAITTRGFKENEMQLIANWIIEIINSCGDTKTEEKVRNEVLELCNKFPIYKNM